MDGVMDARGGKNWREVLVLLLAVCGTVLGQTAGGSQAAQAGEVGDGAAAEMQKSLQMQQAALDAFREKAQNGSIREQQSSATRQVEGIQPRIGATTGSGSGASPPQAENSRSSGFFMLPWPGSLPLSMPNVQISTTSCEALGDGEINRLAEAAAGTHGVRADLLRSVMKQESGFKPCALSTAGAMGLMQIMPETADLLHLDDPFDPQKNVDAGAKFLKMMLDRFGGDLALALAAYNAGPGAVERAQGVPPISETLEYISNILGGLPVAY
jgi:soluble lytic murein transglycosylase-like protein